VGDSSGLRNAARGVLLTGAAASLGLMLRAGARQRSAVLILLFAGWVLSPFVALALADRRAQRWPARVRTALYAAMAGVSGLCVAIYAMHAIRGVMKAGFVYLVVPAAAWLLIAVALGVNAIAARRALK
jgi:hypothetical protein